VQFFVFRAIHATIGRKIFISVTSINSSGCVILTKNGDNYMMNNTTLPTEGFVKLEQVLTVVPVSKSTWYRGVQTGLYPKPVKLGERAVAWKVEEIRECVELLGCSTRR